MKYFKTAHEKKSAIITTLITTLLILLFFIIGLKYFDPPISYGMEVNFGNVDQGMGKDISKEELVSNIEPKSEPIKKTINPTPKPATQNKVVSQEISDVNIQSKKSEEEVVKKKITPEKLSPPKPKVNETTKNILSKLVNQSVVKTIHYLEVKEMIMNLVTKENQGNPYSNSYFDIAGPRGWGKDLV